MKKLCSKRNQYSIDSVSMENPDYSSAYHDLQGYPWIGLFLFSSHPCSIFFLTML